MEHRSNTHENHHCHGGKLPSSYWMQDNGIVFEKFALKEGDCFIDMGCGNGDYSLHAAKFIGKTGKVYALDRIEEAIKKLKNDSGAQETGGIIPLHSDITEKLPLDDACGNVALIATVLHHFCDMEKGAVMMEEAYRVLKPDGRLFIIECKKEETPHGPPLAIRISPEETEEFVTRFGFRKTGFTDLGNNYMLEFGKTGE